jgi:hypothetical protein
LLLYVAPVAQLTNNPWEIVPYLAVVGLVAGVVIERARNPQTLLHKAA